MSTFLYGIGLIILALSAILMLFGIGVTIKDAIGRAYRFDTIDGISFFLGGAMLLLVGVMIIGLGAAVAEG